MKYFALCAALLLPFAGQAKTPSAWRAVMRAQYAAKTPVPPLSAPEAKRIYQAYLRGIGRPHGQRATLGAQSEPVVR
jgi:hypothetical protein